jgi:hypothetical protein
VRAVSGKRRRGPISLPPDQQATAAPVGEAKVIAFAHARHMMPRKPVEERIAGPFPKAPKRRPRHRGKRDPDSG